MQYKTRSLFLLYFHVKTSPGYELSKDFLSRYQGCTADALGTKRPKVISTNCGGARRHRGVLTQGVDRGLKQSHTQLWKLEKKSFMTFVLKRKIICISRSLIFKTGTRPN